MKLGLLRQYAVEGVRQRLLAIERECHTLYRDFPDLFIGDGPPEFVRAEPISSNGHRPAEDPVRIIVRPPRTVRGKDKQPRKRRGVSQSHPIHSIQRYEKIAAFLRDHDRAGLAVIARGLHDKSSGGSSTFHRLKVGVTRGFFVKHDDATYSLGSTPVSQ